MRRDVQLFLGKEKYNPPSIGDNIVSNSELSSDSNYNLINHTVISGGRCEMTMLSGSEASINQNITALEPSTKYQIRLDNIEYPDEELVINRAIATEDLNNSSWAKSGCSVTINDTVAPDGTNTADRIFAYSTNYVQDTFNWFTGEPIYLSVYVKKETSSTVSLFANKDKVSFNIDTQTFVTAHNWSDLRSSFAGNGWYRISGKYTPAADESKTMGIKDISSGFSIWAWGFQVQREGSLGTYFKNDSTINDSYSYVNHTTQTVSNLVGYSRDLNDPSWGKTRIIAIDNESIDFFGQNKGTLIESTFDSFSAYVYKNIAITDETIDYTLTFYVKPKNSNYAAFRVRGSGSGGTKDYLATLNFSDGSVTNESGNSTPRFATYEYQNSGWWKVSVGLEADGISNFQLLFAPRLDDGTAFSAVTTVGFASMYMSGIQLEKNTVGGQYIANSGSSEVELSRVGNTIVISDTLNNNGGLQYTISPENQTTSKVIDFITTENTGDLRIRIDGTSSTATLNIDNIYIFKRIDAFYSQEQYSVDMFDFEDINIVDKIKDVKDISKVFTEYTQKFTVPASPNNNKLFDHFYNEDVVSGFDHRIKHDAVIKIGGADYKHGQLTMMSSTIKNGLAHSYSVVFYGNTVKLNDLLGDDKLSDLTGTILDKLNIEYNSSTVLDLMTNGMFFDENEDLVVGTDNSSDAPTPDVFAPFISCDSHYFYDSVDQPQVKDRVSSRNVKFDSGQATRGIYYKDLKLAIKVKFLIRAIEEKYGIKFSREFFSDDNEVFNELSMLLHKEKGGISSQLETQTDVFTLSDLVKRFTFSSATQGDYRGVARYGADSIGWDADYLDWVQVNSFQDQIFGLDRGYHSYLIEFDIVPTGSGEYSIDVTDTSENAPDNSGYSWRGTGSKQVRHVFRTGSPNTGSHQLLRYKYVKPRFAVSTESGISAYRIENFRLAKVHRATRISSTNVDGWTELHPHVNYQYDNENDQAMSDGVQLASQLPNMKVISFLTSMFKMYNLTAYSVPATDISEFAGQIRVRSIDNYYLSGNDVDITNFVDTSKTDVSKNKLYSEVRFEFSPHKTLAPIKQHERTGDVFGSEVMENLNSNINSPLAFDGGKYAVKTDFEKAMYERMTDQSDEQTILPIQWGWMASRDENPVVGKALLFYPIYENVSPYTDEQGNYITLDYDTSIYDKNKNVLSQSHTAFHHYIRPSNSLKDNGKSLNFGSEYDEWYVWEGSGSNEDSLFNNNYLNYINSIYDIQSRLITIDTYLPVNIVMKLKLNDVVIIKQKRYRINSLDLNLTTGKAKMELMNDLVYSLMNLSNITISVDEYIDSVIFSGRRIAVNDPSRNSVSEYRVYVDGVLLKTFTGGYVNILDSELGSGTHDITMTSFLQYDQYTTNESEHSNIITITI